MMTVLRWVMSLLMLNMVGCTKVVMEYDPATKTVKKRQIGSEEELLRDSVDFELKREAGGEKPSAGIATWKEYWQWRISLWKKESNRSLEPYLYRRRSELGLKAL